MATLVTVMLDGYNVHLSNSHSHMATLSFTLITFISCGYIAHFLLDMFIGHLYHVATLVTLYIRSLLLLLWRGHWSLLCQMVAYDQIATMITFMWLPLSQICRRYCILVFIDWPPKERQYREGEEMCVRMYGCMCVCMFSSISQKY